MARAYNFAPGPAALPESVLKQAQADMLEWGSAGASIVEMSHRGPEFMEVATRAEADLRTLLGVPDDYAVLFLPGGATTAQALLPLNFANQGDTVDYVVTGHWGKTALKQLTPAVSVNVAASGEADGYRMIPARESWRLTPGAAYVHITANETIHGVEYRPAWGEPAPDTGNVPLFADFSSSIASEPIDISRYGVIYAGAQKNLGPVGISVVIVRRDLLERAGQPRAEIFNYGAQLANDSMLNTPPTWNWYVAGLVFRWMLDEGGTAEFNRRSDQKSALLYAAIDESGGFYRNDIDAAVRSRMNVPFFLADEARNAAFLDGAREAGLIGLKGHRVLGGMRASIYNAMPVDGVRALVAYMQDFQKTHG
ncbi:3-phosphoserine/phosphohydroxythreonine aminotransferase [Luteimonas sp. 9C]|uniref:3-phosphoserine/phosphohydroxythreonine transaminase n=1 Tax=Luteimonas sp. 9C TaxID=2653148 RepID=UPI0012F21FF8|nr:3-phosphoserine/phosphohydroxythreonine transaminase [Luteimonas sp. 9C]VXB31034.1 3-phosphoserine/phosphohydroxythreonine aminotransferase [Luteimonas sp. 9C]